jgi:hypothetical protein
MIFGLILNEIVTKIVNAIPSDSDPIESSLMTGSIEDVKAMERCQSEVTD